MTTIYILLAFVAGIGFGMSWQFWHDNDVMDADADELAMLRRQVREQAEELTMLREEYGNYDWISEEWMLAGRVE